MNGVAAWRLDLISGILAAGGVIAYPTEGVWGLGCLPGSRSGVAAILSLKNRSWQEGLLLVAADILQFSDYLEGLPPQKYQELQDTWPSPTTFLVPDNGTAPSWITGRHDTVGLRVPDHPVVQSLCRRLGPLVSTSANISGRPPARTALEVRRYFGPLVDHVVPGALGAASGPSTIRILMSGKVIR